KEFDREVENMCNISTMYVNRGIEQGLVEKTIQVIIEMARKNLPISMIADIVHLSVEETEKIIKENS
ncbi:MAG: hypothetical protein ACI4JM_05565, partial [Oscillospiraceae bacterium]